MLTKVESHAQETSTTEMSDLGVTTDSVSWTCILTAFIEHNTQNDERIRGVSWAMVRYINRHWHWDLPTSYTKKTESNGRHSKPVDFDGSSATSSLLHTTCGSGECRGTATVSTASSSVAQLAWLTLALQLALHDEFSSALSSILNRWLTSWLSHCRRCCWSGKSSSSVSCRTTTSCRLVAAQFSVPMANLHS